MSGALKHFFDSTFLQVGGALDDSGGAGDGSGGGSTAKRPYGLWVHGRYDVTGAVRGAVMIGGVSSRLEAICSLTDAARGLANAVGPLLF